MPVPTPVQKRPEVPTVNDLSTSRAAPAAAPEEPAPGLSELYLRHRRELVGFVRRQFGAGPPDPEDVVQQAFANLAALPADAALRNPRAFLYRTAHNIAINHCNRERIGRRFLEPAPAPEEVREAREDFDPEVVQMGREDYSLIEQAIRAMPARRRRFLLLNRIDGMSFADIARREGLSESAVRKQVVLAVQECGAALLRAAAPVRRPGEGDA